MTIVAALAALALVASPPAASAGQTRRDSNCTEWQQCRDLAIAAADRGEFETFHDLAWRTVQTGPRNDPALMYLLARAQALSGRSHDALVMLQRLADMGVASDAATNDDFRWVRELAGWTDVAVRFEHLRRPESAPPAPERVTPAVVPPAPAPVPMPAAAPEPKAVPGTAATLGSSIAEAARFSTGRFTVGGLAYDAVSQRFLFGDRRGRKLIVVSEGSDHPVDLVRAESAGFHEISAVEIDVRRGDLWVASTAPDTGAGSVHRLQLVSGRPLKAFPLGADVEPVRLVDLAVTPAGHVLVLDAHGGQLLMLRAGADTLERIMRLELPEPASLAVSGDERFAYVAHRDGLARIDLQRRAVTAVATPKDVSLAHIERIRRHLKSLVAVQVDADSRRILRLELNAAGTAVAGAETLQAPMPAGETSVTIAGDELLYLTGDAGSPSEQSSSSSREFITYRLRLR